MVTLLVLLGFLASLVGGLFLTTILDLYATLWAFTKYLQFTPYFALIVVAFVVVLFVCFPEEEK